MEDGLPSDHVYRITQDRSGFIWAVTDKGIAKFNGKEFKTFTTKNGLPTNDIWDIRLAPNNEIWYFSKSNVLGYIKNDSVYNFPACDKSVVLYPSSIFQYENMFMFGNNNKGYTLVDGCWKYVPDQHKIQKNLKEPKVYSGASARDRIISLYYNRYDFFKIKNRNEYPNILLFLSVDSIGGMLYDDGYMILNLNNNRLFNRKFKNDLRSKHPRFYRFNFLNDELQISGYNFVARLGKEYHIKEFFHVQKELESHFSLIDRSGNIWSATFTDGIYMLPQVKRNFRYFLSDKKGKKVAKVGDKIIANVIDKGFYEYDENRQAFKQILKEDGFLYSANYIDSLQTYFYVSESKVFEIGKDNVKKVRFINKGTGLRKIIFFNGFLYANTSGGVVKINAKDFNFTKKYRQYGVKSLIPFNDQIILGTSNGLMTLKNDTILEFPFSDSNIRKPILDLIAVAPSQLLVGTDGYGAYLTDMVTTKLLPGTEFLSVENIFASEADVWLATETGLLHYQKFGDDYKLVKKLDDTHGLPSRKINAVTVVNDEVFVSTDNGLAIFPKNFEKRQQLLDIYIEKASYDNVLISPKQDTFSYSRNNTVTFSVSGIDYSENRPDLIYDYKLSPLHSQWTQTSSSSINFTDLPPNDYTLFLKSGTINKTVTFSITPLWWQRSITKISFITLGVLLLGIVLYRIRKYEIAKKTRKLTIQKKLAEFELYALRSQMNPHFVFNSLAAIQYYINNNETETSERYLVKFSKLIRQFFELSKEKEITLADEITLPKNYLDIEKLRFKEKLNYTINVDENIITEEFKIPTMILQPIVENAVNHGIFNKEENGNIMLNFKYLNSSEIKAEICDDGVGYVNTKKNRTNGKINSSDVIEERIFHLNNSGMWHIEYSKFEVYPGLKNKGNIATFTIKTLQ